MRAGDGVGRAVFVENGTDRAEAGGPGVVGRMHLVSLPGRVYWDAAGLFNLPEAFECFGEPCGRRARVVGGEGGAA